MGKILVLAEKPSVGRDIARVLGCKNEKNGYIEGSKYIVTWALGHFVTSVMARFYFETKCPEAEASLLSRPSRGII